MDVAADDRRLADVVLAVDEAVRLGVGVFGENRVQEWEAKQPQLVAQIEQVVKRGGLEIPRERMFEMNASSKMKSLNAYVTGFGASKRVVHGAGHAPRGDRRVPGGQAAEMAQRAGRLLHQSLGLPHGTPPPVLPWCGTFHSVAARPWRKVRAVE